jgi:hypothetical protein
MPAVLLIWRPGCCHRLQRDYSLGTNLYSNNLRTIKQYYEEIKAGTCWVNDPLTDNDAGPFGGMKFSGGARAGRGGLAEFLETKHVHWDFRQEKKSWCIRIENCRLQIARRDA